jgi:hypothetical protein
MRKVEKKEVVMLQAERQTFSRSDDKERRKKKFMSIAA